MHTISSTTHFIPGDSVRNIHNYWRAVVKEDSQGVFFHVYMDIYGGVVNYRVNYVPELGYSNLILDN